MSYSQHSFRCRTCDEVNKVKVGRTFIEDCCHNPLIPVMVGLLLLAAIVAGGLVTARIYGPANETPLTVVEYITVNGYRYKVEGGNPGGGERLELKEAGGR